jgi:hypothetical protein
MNTISHELTNIDEYRYVESMAINVWFIALRYPLIGAR